MTSGRSNKIVGQTGEYLVAAELSRRGLIATTFTGNVPHYDIIASDEKGHHVSVQVKASRSGSWQFGDIRSYFDIKLQGDRQIIGDAKTSPVRQLIMVFVKIGENRDDRFYILTWESLRDLIRENYKANLAKHDGIRPRRADSMHAGMKEMRLAKFKDNWEIIPQNLR